MNSGNLTYWRLFLEPMRYNFTVRIPALNKQLSWLFINLFPTLYFALCGVEILSAQHLLSAFVLCFGVYYLYEFGYIYNDAIATKREENPTCRLCCGQQKFAEAHLCSIFAVRLLTYVASMALVWFSVGDSNALIIIILASLVPILFFVYNRWRTTSNVWLYFWLVASRFVPFAWLFPDENVWLRTLLLVLIYPLAIGIERFSRPQKRFPLVRKIIPNEEAKPRFRFFYYLAVLVVLVPLTICQILSWQLVLPFALFAIYRFLLIFREN